MPKQKLPELEIELSPEPRAALAALLGKPNDIPQALATFVAALSAAERVRFTTAVMTFAREVVKAWNVALPAMQHGRAKDTSKQLSRSVERLKLAACAVCRIDHRPAEAFADMVLKFPLAWPRCQLLEVFVGMHGGPPVKPREVGTKLLAASRPDRGDLYTAYEALYAAGEHVAREHIRKVLRAPARTWAQKLRVDVACDMLVRKEQLDGWLGDVYPHVLHSELARGLVEQDAAGYVKYIAWARKHGSPNLLVKHVTERIPFMPYHGPAWIEAVRPSLEGVLAAAQKRKDRGARALATAMVENIPPR